MLFAPLNGTLAVFVFFVVSGFSLSTRYLVDGDKRKWVATASGRYLRLAIPILAACLVVHLAMKLGLVSPPDIRLEKFRTILAFTPTTTHLFRFATIDVFFDYRPASTYIGPLWTMSLELIGSYIVLFSVLALRPAPFRPALLCMVSTLILWIAPDTNLEMLALFPIGAAIADAYHRKWLDRVPPLASIAMMSASLAILPTVPFSVTAWGIFGATPFVVGAIAAPKVRAFFSSTLSGRLGKISFPLYLLHGAVMCVIGEPLTRHFGQVLSAKLLINVFVVFASFGAAFLFMPIERWSIAASHWFGRKAAALVGHPGSRTGGFA